MNKSLAVGLASSVIFGLLGFLSAFAFDTPLIFKFCVGGIFFTYFFLFGLWKNEIGYNAVGTLFGRRIKSLFQISVTLLEGWNWVLPRPIMGIESVDVRETTINPPKTRVHAQNLNTTDANIPVYVDLSAQVRVVDAFLSLDIKDIPNALALVLERAAREICSNYKATELPTVKNELSDKIRESVQTIAKSWGVEVILVRVQDIDLPKAIEDAAMNVVVEQLQATAETIELRHVAERVKELIETGLSPGEALEAVQTERGKARKIILGGTGAAIAVVGEGGINP